MLPETLTEAEAEDVLRLARQALQRSPAEEALQVDASALGRYDSSALAVLLETRRLARAWGRACSVSGLPAPLVELARLYGIDGLLELAPPADPPPGSGRPAEAGPAETPTEPAPPAKAARKPRAAAASADAPAEARSPAKRGGRKAAPSRVEPPLLASEPPAAAERPQGDTGTA